MVPEGRGFDYLVIKSMVHWAILPFVWLLPNLSEVDSKTIDLIHNARHGNALFTHHTIIKCTTLFFIFIATERLLNFLYHSTH